MIQLRIQYPDNIKFAQNPTDEDENGNISLTFLFFTLNE